MSSIRNALIEIKILTKWFSYESHRNERSEDHLIDLFTVDRDKTSQSSLKDVSENNVEKKAYLMCYKKPQKQKELSPNYENFIGKDS